MMQNTALVETSMSTLLTFLRCRKKYEYGEVLGWVPRSAPAVMEKGTLFHGCLAAGMRTLHGSLLGFDTSKFVEAAVNTAYTMDRDRNGMALSLTMADRELMDDMIRYAWQTWLEAEVGKWAAILSVEEPAYIQIGKYLIRNTFDAVVEYKPEYGGEAVVLDWKTVDDPRDGKDWIPLDFQTRSYPLAARGKWGRTMPFKHIFIARSVPPGFGHNPITTASGKKRDAATLERMSNPDNFTAIVDTRFTDKQLDHFERKLVGIVQDLNVAVSRESFPESTMKVGPFACSNCPFYTPCTMQMDGNGDGFSDLLYIKKDSKEWADLQALAEK